MGVVLRFADLFGFVALLLWGTHMVTTGVQRGYGALLRQRLGQLLRRGRSAFGAGIAVTLALQSSTATGLMGASFVAEGLIALDTGFVMMLGANVGTALVARALSFPIAMMAPIGILIGFALFRRAKTTRIRNLGRVSMGLGLMLLALHLLVDTLNGWLNGPLAHQAMTLVVHQPVLVGLAALALTWMCHSSVAVILLGSALAAGQGWPVETLFAFLMGANLGGALPPALETQGVEAKRLPVGNLVMRGLGVALLWLSQPFWGYVPTAWTSRSDFLVNAHLLFNVTVAVLGFPLVRSMGNLVRRWLPDPPIPVDPGQPRHLAHEALSSPSLALANAEQETLRLANKAQELFQHALAVLRLPDEIQVKELRQDEQAIGRLAGSIRGYLSHLPTGLNTRENRRQAETLRFVYGLEQLSDIVTHGLIRTAMDQHKAHQAFNAEEWQAIQASHAEVFNGFRLAIAVFLGKDVDAARRLLEQKSDMRVLETEVVAGRLGHQGDALIVVLRDLKRIHSHLTGVAYQLLEEEGQLQPRVVSTPSLEADGDEAETQMSSPMGS